MNRKQLRDDFEQAFKEPEWDLKRAFSNPKEYRSYHTQAAWLAWVSSFETYSNEPLTGEYE